MVEAIIRLNRTTAPPTHLILDTPPAHGIVHIGLGNFHRAHLAVYTAEAVAKAGGEWGIYAYSMRSDRNARELKEQDFCYSVVDIHPDSMKTVIPGIHSGASGGPEAIEEVFAQLIDKRTRIISLTITESGYCYSTQTGGLDTSRSEIIHDINNLHQPESVIGLLAHALIARAQSHRAPVTILSCDNLTSNGSTTKRVLCEFAQKLVPDKTTLLLEYLEERTSFPNSMVDRIVPSTEERHRILVSERLGVRDEIPVPAEKFSMWVLEDNFIAGRPAWELSGAIFSDEVEKFETMKLRLLNGSHSLLAYVGALAGKASVPEARFTPYIEDAVRKFMKEEMAPTFQMPNAIDIDEYIADLFSRWSNTVLSDTTARIGSDGSIKLPPRITESSLWHSERNQATPLTALVLAAWLACMAPPIGFEPGSIARAMKDPALEYLALLSAGGQPPAEIVERLFADGKIFSRELNTLTELKNQTTAFLEQIIKSGIEVTVQEAISF
jgi:fructuronate reductase